MFWVTYIFVDMWQNCDVPYNSCDNCTHSLENAKENNSQKCSLVSNCIASWILMDSFPRQPIITLWSNYCHLTLDSVSEGLNSVNIPSSSSCSHSSTITISQLYVSNQSGTHRARADKIQAIRLHFVISTSPHVLLPYLPTLPYWLMNGS